MTSEHDDTLRAIRSHFGAGNSPSAEHSMFEHIADCTSCRTAYERYAAISDADPEAPSRRERLLRGLGVRERRANPVWAWRTAVPAIAALAAAALILFLGPWMSPRDGLVARGNAARPELIVYRVVEGSGELVTNRVRSSDVLAFAYTNPEGAPFLLVFAIGADDRVHWYYPAWHSVTEDPSAVAASGGAAVHELPEGVRHDLAVGELTVFAAFADRAWRVRDVESSIRMGTVELPGATIVSKPLVVEEDPE